VGRFFWQTSEGGTVEGKKAGEQRKNVGREARSDPVVTHDLIR